MSHDSALVPGPGGVHVELTTSRPRYLNPLLALPGTVDDDVVRLCFAGLTRVSPRGVVVPDLALRWDVGPDLLSYTFTLRPDATFHSGQPLRLADVLASLRAVQSASFPCPPALTDYWQGVRIETPTDNQIRLLVSEPDATLPEACALGIVPENWLRSVETSDPRQSAFNARPIGAGPYRVAEADRARVTLEPAPGYQGARPFLRRVEFVVQPDEATGLRALSSHTATGMVVSDPIAAGLGDDQAFVLNSTPLSGRQTVLVLNTTSPLLANSAVRRAFRLAIDSAQVGQAALGVAAAPAAGPVSPHSWAYDPAVERPTYVPNRARAGLDAAGWTGGPGTRQREGKPFELDITVSSAEHVRAGQSIVAQLQQVGIGARLRAIPGTDYIERVVARRQFDALVATLATSTVDPALYWHYHSSQVTGGLNLSGWANQRADRALDAARREQSLEGRRRAYADFEVAFAEDCPAVSLYWPALQYVFDRRIRGVELGAVSRPSDRLAGITDWHVAARRVPVLL